MKKKKDVLFLCQFFYPEYISSATLPYDTAVALENAGYDVGVMCGYPKEYNLEKDVPLKEIKNGVEIKRVKYIQLKRSNKIGRLINYFSFTASIFLHIGYINNYHSVIVYSNPPILPVIAALANLFFGTKIIYVSYDVYPEIAYKTNSLSPTSFIGKLMAKMNIFVFSRTERVIALSNDMKLFLLKNRNSLSENQIKVIPNWYEDKNNKNKKMDIKNKMFKEIKLEGNLVVSYFGNMGICQDLNTLTDAMKVLRNDANIKFMIAGHGNKLESLKEIVEKEKLSNVYIFDYLHGDDYKEALSISDTFIVSLEKGLSGLAVPSKTYSYMMAGKPVIAVMDQDTDIAEELKNHNAGFSIEVGNDKKLVEAIYKLKNNEELIKEMARNCRELFLTKYTTEKGTEQYVKIIDELMEEKKYVYR
ncbi:capsular polysaccharide synthesis enzyme [Carnobacterium sp. AT7]|uniref:glycosyltransferase family 4 protein n=1 Tax=Carnobacterium sp. AT7 TaxID=333990 RepID=UPI00015F172E|nr:glycosyltransferase family 4 protein [Carnobacterium sp. AT7]EDP68093.1 capsular polysaccharide synthesis enzyme [Carnobacterium sp. AT7]